MENDVAYVLSAGIGFLCGEVRVIILVCSGMQTEKGASECLLEAILIHPVKVLEMKVLFNDLEYSG